MTPDEQPPDFLRSRCTPKKPKKKSSRRGWLKGALGLGTVGAGGGIYTRYWEPRNLRVSRHSLPAENGQRVTAGHLVLNTGRKASDSSSA